MTAAHLGIGLGAGVGGGSGLLVRRDDALLFLSAPAEGTAPALRGLVDEFLGAADGEVAKDLVTAAVVEARFEVEPFAMVSWRDVVSVLVVGDVEVTSDLPTLPMLSGRGSSSWVEHRAPRQTRPCELRVGAPSTPGTDLRAGAVPADGFVLALDFSVASPEPAVAVENPPATPVTTPNPTPTTAPAPTPAEAPTVDGVPTQEPVIASAPAHDRAAGWAALQAATGGDWMEDSLGLPPSAITPATAPPATAAAATTTDEFDPEITLDPAVFHASTATATAADATTGAGGSASTAEPAPLPPPTGEPAGTSGDHRPTLQARRCPRQHVNPLTAALCRQCREPIDPRAAVEMVVQPALGRVVLPDGVTLPIDGSIVLGRQPDPSAARVEEPVDVRAIAAGPDVSRTHLVLRAVGWTIEAVDCASTGHSVLVPGSGADPVELEAWVPHEVMAGDTIYLGGPTNIRVIA